LADNRGIGKPSTKSLLGKQATQFERMELNGKPMRFGMNLRPILQTLICLIFCGATLCSAKFVFADHLTLKVGGKVIELDGEILIEAKDKSIYFREVDGKIWFVEPDQIQAKVDSDEAVEPLSKEEIGKRLLKELPRGFRIYETEHYVIAYQNEIAFARWIGGLYESRLYKAFETFWVKRKKLKLEDPSYPLVTIVFGSKAQYQQYVDRELGPGQDMIAYYNIQTNRVAMFDLTSDQRNPNEKMNDRKIDQVLQNPAAIMMVATIIHEATHQLMFNRGVQTRFAETPLWLNEGLAMYFEAPDLGNRHGWKKPGLIFQRRLIQFRQFAASRPVNSLRTLIESDERLRTPGTVADGYAEAWAFNHFLMTKKSKQYVAYIKHMSQKKPLRVDSPEVRLVEFEQFFDETLAELDAEFLDYVRRLN